MSSGIDNISEWFKGRPIWLQAAAHKLLLTQELSAEDIEELLSLCKNEASGNHETKNLSFNLSMLDKPKARSIHLDSIGNIVDINALAPKKPLEFGDSNLSVIYGFTGSGKSGYIRILKHACGAKHIGDLLPNVFLGDRKDQQCTICYKNNGDPKKIIVWKVTSGFIEELKTIDIYDATCGLLYVTDENSVTYEPYELTLFSELINICDNIISPKLEQEIKNLPSKLPDFPLKISSDTVRKWYGNLSHETPDDEIVEYCSWTDENQQELDKLSKRLAEESPLEMAKYLRVKKTQVDSFIDQLKIHYKSLSELNCKKIFELKQDALTKREAADTAATDDLKLALLDGVGSGPWRLLWEKAREYSEEEAYKDKEFPYLEKDARCVLCQQEISSEAKTRLESFENYIKGKLQREATDAENLLDKRLSSIAELPSVEELRTKFSASDISDEKLQGKIIALFSSLRERKFKLKSISNLSEMPYLPKGIELSWMKIPVEKAAELEKDAKRYEKDAESNNRNELEVEKDSFEARKWLHEQEQAIKEEIARLEKVDLLENAKKLARTNALTVKKDTLAEELITPEYKSRFNQELDNLSANNIGVDLVKTRSKKGKVLHRLKLKGVERFNPSEILSTGEFRIISIAAFLADVTGKEHASPFIFDDPISSIDHNYEEAVIKRLVKLSEKRQVIIFTHRLSMLGLLQDEAKNAGIKPSISYIKQESWGAGEPGETPLSAMRPNRFLNLLIRERLERAKKLFNEEGTEAYYDAAKSICSDIRILIERIIETTLLAEVVLRYRREIQTKNRLVNLARIKKSDCDYLDELMSKYSRFEHSQSMELPPKLLLPDELSEDLTKLKSWHEEFLEREIVGD